MAASAFHSALAFFSDELQHALIVIQPLGGGMSHTRFSLWRPWQRTLAGFAVGAALAIGVSPVQALPSFARQTGMECASCHVGGFGPQLTPAGTLFKMGGYTDSDGKDGKIPLSAMVIGSYTHTREDQDPEPGLKANNNLKMNEAALFFAGRVTDSIGGFAELNYDGIEHKTAVDRVDFRYARALRLDGRDATFGISVNNTPSSSDPFNTLPASIFPYTDSPAAVGTGESATLINGGLEHRVLGAVAYANYGGLYGELGSYGSLSPSLQSKIGQGRDYQRLSMGSNAYWRLAWMQDLKTQAFHVGVFGWSADVQPDRTVASPKDRYHDVGVDAGYQLLGNREHMLTLNGSYVREHRTDIEGAKSSLRETRLNASYYYQQTWGASIGRFATTGSDPAAATRGQMLQLDWTPWGKENANPPAFLSLANLRLGLQYWNYNEFGGLSSGAKDHNTTYLFSWLSF
ncbi:MAG: cytochrome C [Azoarcus sp.]|jgi:hypothetical protein|nr:cytochrome C [Azoarcus sp.]